MKRGGLLLLLISSCIHAQDLLKLSFKAKGVTAMSYSPDNAYLALAVGDDIELYNAGNDTKVKSLDSKDQHARDVLDIGFSSDATLVATSSADRKVKIWKIPSGELVTTLVGHTAAVVGARFIDHDRFIVSASEDLTVKLWSADSAKLVYSKKDSQKPIRALDISSDGKYFAIGGGDKTILVYEALTGEIKNKIQGHKDWVRTLVFSPDGKFIASGGDDKMIYLWEAESGKMVKEFPQKGWTYDLEFSSEGKYLFAALEKYAVMAYNIATGLPSLKLEDFQSSILEISISPSGKELTTVEEFGAEVKFWNIESLHIAPVFHHKDSKDKSAPLILVSNPPNVQDNRVIIYKDLIDLRGTVTDESGVRSLKINNTPTPVRDNGNFLINIPLAMGDNYLNIEVTDVNDNIALKKLIITRKNMGGEEYNPVTAKNHLLVVGINNYQYWPRLNNAVKDANDLVSVLMNKYNFDFSNVTVLKDEQATRSNIYNGLRSLIERISPQDNLVIYFSGHGYFDQLLNEGYWIPVDAKVNSNGDYISNTEILKILGNINSQHTFLVADACFSGALFADSRRGYTENVEKFKSRWGLASGRLETVSDGEIGSNSPFAKRVIQFLRDNTKEKFAISELVQYVKTQVAEDTNQTPIGNPLKTLGDEGGEMVFYRKKQ